MKAASGYMLGCHLVEKTMYRNRLCPWHVPLSPRACSTTLGSREGPFPFASAWHHQEKGQPTMTPEQDSPDSLGEGLDKI